MRRLSKYYQYHLYRAKVTQEPESLSGTGSAGKEGRAYVMRVDYRARVTFAAATPAVQAQASTVKKLCRSKKSLFGARQNPATFPDNAKALD
jgi:hypothetical protein